MRNKKKELCKGNNLVNRGSLFQHKEIHKWTLNFPDDKKKTTTLTIIIINRRWRESLQDVWASGGADVGSDYNLVMVKLKLKL